MEEESKRPSLARTGTVMLEQKDGENNNNNSPNKRQKSAILTRYPSHLFKFSRSATFGDGGQGVNDWLQKYLPYEILLFIFTMLHRTDFTSASKVCKHFRAVTRDPIFGWVTFFRNDFQGYFYAYDWATKTDKPGPETYDFSKLDFRSGWSKNWSFFDKDSNTQLFTVTHDVVLNMKSRYARNKQRLQETDTREKAVIDVMAACKSHPKMFRYFFKYKGRNSSQHKVSLVAQLHVHSLELLARKQDPIPALPLIIEWVEEQAEQIADQRVQFYIGSKEIKVPMKSNYATKQPSGLKEGINLYKYQLDAVRWMKSVEADIAAKIPFKYVTLMPWRAASSEVLFDLQKGLAIPSNKLQEHITSFYPKGGVLADEMGLGKTIEVLGLVLSNPPTVEEEAEINARNTENLDNENEFEKLQFKTKATLVACPNHLAQQWQEELIKFSDPPLKVLKFTTVPEIKASSYEEIAQADVVLVAVQLLKYASYQNIGKATKKAAATKQKANFKAREKRVETMLKKARKAIAKEEDVEDPPLLEHFQWHRLVIDEAHEIVADDEYQDIFSLFKAKYYWYVSGTPIPSENVLLGILEFLEFPYDSSANYMKHTFADIFWNNLYWRNTKESVKDEYTIPDVIEDLVLLEFTDVEKVLYKEFADADKKKLCSKMPQIGSCKTLSDVKEFKVDEKKKTIKSLRTTIFALKQELEEIPEQLETLQKEFAEFDNTWSMAKNRVQSRINTLTSRRNQGIPSELQKNEHDLKVQTEFLELYEAARSYKQKMANANKLTRALSSPLKSPLRNSSNNNNNNDAMEAEAPKLPSEDEIPSLNVTQLREIISSHNVTPKSNKAEMQKQLKHLIGFIKDERVKAQQESLQTKKRKQEDTKPTETPVKKQKTESESEGPQVDTRVESAKEVLDLVERLGTKMGNLIFYLKKLWRTAPESRVIIFSQFDAVLSQVDEVLSQCDIKSVSVKGNVNQKNEALNAFKDSDSEVKVILLSLAKAASGSNLIQASHVVLIDPISGTKEEVQAVEAQAIGRAYRQGQSQHVTVVRLLIKETEEHAMYIKTYTQEGQQFHDGTLQQQTLEHANEELSRAGSTRMFRASSVGALLANVPSNSASAVVQLVEELEPEVKQEDGMLDSPEQPPTISNEENAAEEKQQEPKEE